jgi:hypothetical protein
MKVTEFESILEQAFAPTKGTKIIHLTAEMYSRLTKSSIGESKRILKKIGTPIFDGWYSVEIKQ